MKITNYNNKSCLDLKDKNGDVNSFQLLITATSGFGKGMTTEAIAERWKKTTGGVCIFLNDPKRECEQSYVMYEPEEKYHLKELRRDSIKKNKYSAKLYHPFSFNLSKKGLLPPLNIFTISIKDLKKDDWSILAETDSETESIKLMERVSDDLPRNASIFDFLQEIERLTDSRKEKSNSPDPKNWFLRSGGGTTKSVRQIGNMLISFRKNYFLRKDTCEYKLDWEKILTDSENYHVFLSNYIDNPKLRNFLVACLMGQAIREAQRLSDANRLNKPILFIIPELLNVCPDETKGSALFLAKTFRKNLVTMRSKAKGMSCLGDTQNWSGTHPIVRGAFSESFFGKLNPDDARIVFKAKSYTSTKRANFEEIQENDYFCAYVWEGHEDEGIIQMFYPSHMHKERKYNWIQMFKKHYREKMENYDSLVKIFRKEFSHEEKSAREIAMSRISKEEKEKSPKKEEEKEALPKKPNKNTAKEYLYKRAHELHNEGFSDRKIAEEIGLGSHKTAKSYYLKYEELIAINSDDIKPNIAAGVMPEEIEMNFNRQDS